MLIDSIEKNVFMYHGKIWLGRDLWRPLPLYPHPSMGNCKARSLERLSSRAVTRQFGGRWRLQRSYYSHPKSIQEETSGECMLTLDGHLVGCRAPRPEGWPGTGSWTLS